MVDKKIPCENCITLPLCIQKYKRYIEENYDWPALKLTNKCNLLFNVYTPIHLLNESENFVDKWWSDNYGE